MRVVYRSAVAVQIAPPSGSVASSALITLIRDKRQLSAHPSSRESAVEVSERGRERLRLPGAQPFTERLTTTDSLRAGAGVAAQGTRVFCRFKSATQTTIATEEGYAAACTTPRPAVPLCVDVTITALPTCVGQLRSTL